MTVEWITPKQRSILRGEAPLDEDTARVEQWPYLLNKPVAIVLEMPAIEAMLLAGWMAGNCGDKTGVLVTGAIRQIELQVREEFGRVLPESLKPYAEGSPSSAPATGDLGECPKHPGETGDH